MTLRPGKRHGFDNRPVDVAFGRQVDHSVDLVVLEDPMHNFGIGDVALDKGVSVVVEDSIQVGQVS